MNSLNKKAVTSHYYNANAIWVSLLLLTAFTYFMGELRYSGATAMLIILMIAAIKGSLIMRDFMGLKNVSLLWRIIMYGWLSIVCVTIAITYVISL
jgi:cytochrome c oxidase subunit 4